jgi:phage gpG-like protein
MSGQAGTFPAVEHAALETIGKLVQHEAQRVIGTYDYGWPQLAEATQADRVRKGFPANEPLLRTGEMERSIEHKVEGRTVHIGSDNDKALWHELGTRTIPPRPFLSGAMAQKEKQIVGFIGRTFSAHIAGKAGTRDMGPPTDL